MAKQKYFSFRLLFKALSNVLENKLSVFLLTTTIVNYFISWKTRTSSEVLTIFTITFLSSLSEVYQENKRNISTRELKKKLKAKMKIVHDGQLKETNVVKRGDIVYVQPGDRILCDVILFDYSSDEYLHKSTSLTVDESLMTGESHPVIKMAIDSIFDSKNKSNREPEKPFLNYVSKKCIDLLKRNKNKKIIQKLCEQNPCINESIVNAGSYVYQGSMFGMVLSRKDKMKNMHKEEFISKNNIVTQSKYFTEKLTHGVIVFSILVFGIAFYKNRSFLESLKVSITLALTVMPEGIDASIKAILLFMSGRLMKFKVYVNNYLKLEKLGNIDVICLDKTGTLTHNKQKIDDIFIFSDLKSDIPLTRVNNREEFYNNNLFSVLFRYCNEVIKINGRFTGDPLDLALIKDLNKFKREMSLPQFISKVPFCPIKKSIEIKVKLNEKVYYLIKGATENIINSCQYVMNGSKSIFITKEMRFSLLNQIDYHCTLGKRIIGCAYKEEDKDDLIFMCIVTFIDPPRSTVKNSIEWCRKNNIEVTVITGDSLLTTKSICESIGLLTPQSKQSFVKGCDIESMDNLTDLCSVYRAEPIHKLKIIQYYKEQGKSVLMTGDGLNDIMAMKESCVSMAMGSGSYYCKELSDLIVLDDNFNNIVECIKLGRKSSHNIFCLFKYLISSNLGELISVMLSLILNGKECLSSSNLLLINLITDGLPVIVICFNEGDSSKKKERITPPIIFRSLMLGLYIGISTFLLYKNSIKIYSHARATTRSTIYIITCELVNTINNINLRKPIVTNKIWIQNRCAIPVIVASLVVLFLLVRIKYFRIWLSFSEISCYEFMEIVVFSVPVLILDEMMKILMH